MIRGLTMRPSDIWPASARIVEVGATNASVCQGMIAAGYERYLAVAANRQRCEQFSRGQAALRRRVVTPHCKNAVRQNNADVLILSGPSVFALAQIRSIGHAHYVAVRLQATPYCWFALLLGFIQCLMLRLTPTRIINCGVDGPWLMGFRVRRRRPHSGVRRFVPHQLGVRGLLLGLQAAGVRHAVLRWFETLPHISPNEDIDLLVDDASLDDVRSMLDDGPGIQPLDLYSVTGLPGSDYCSMPYFPPHLSEELLDRAVVHQRLCRVPAPREHFLSLAYHALYHKGRDSAIPSAADGPQHCRAADHNYLDVLQRLARDLGFDVAPTLEGLDAFLQSQGWRPPHDMLVRLSRRNRWARTLLQHPDQASSTDDRIAVFLLREEGMRRGGIERATQMLEQSGFQILSAQEFGERKSVIARSLRGGNWGRGPWPTSGGPPAAAIVAYDPEPIAPGRRDKKRFPFLTNARLLCKEKIRDQFNEGLAKEHHCNVIHSSDNGREAIEYLQIIMPSEFQGVVERANSHAARRAA